MEEPRAVAPGGGLESGWTVGPLRGEPLDAWTAAVYKHHVAVLGVDPFEAGEHRARLGDVLAVRNGDQRTCGQVQVGLALLPRADEVAGVYGHRGQVPGLARVVAMAGAPNFAGLGAVMLGGGIAHILGMRVAPGPHRLVGPGAVVNEQ